MIIESGKYFFVIKKCGYVNRVWTIPDLRVIIGTPDSDDSNWAHPAIYPWRSHVSPCCSDPRGVGAPASCILSELEFG